MARADAAGAYLDAADSAVIERFNLLQVRMPGAAGFVVCVADVIAEAGTFPAYFTEF